MAALAIAIAMTCCTKRGAKIAAAGWGMGGLGYHTYILAKMTEDIGNAFGNEEAKSPTGMGVLSLSLMLTGGALVLWGTAEGVHGYVAPSRATADAVKTGPAAHARAWQLTKLAVTAARVEDCEAVRAFAPQIQELDAELYEDVFLHEPALARCAPL